MSLLPADPSDFHGAFAQLHTGVQRQLWRMQWTHLRPLQVQSIHGILGGTQPVLIAAATAAGKTEAAFLPILSQLAAQRDLEAVKPSVRVLYVGPLRALINDQFERLEELCEHLEIPVHRWHGDVGATAKRKLIEKPGGVLLLTPESLESLFVNRSHHLPSLFGGLEFVVIDELHAFLGTERGRQLLSLLARLEITCEVSPRRIGLSATLGKVGREDIESDYQVARRFLSPTELERVLLIEDLAQKGLGYRIYSHLAPADTEPEDDELAVERLIATDIAKHFTGITSLIFANARGDVEAYADLCQQMMPNEIRVHHGSLARDIRQETEERLKEAGKNRAITAFCSSTLELGIDLGDVTAVGQIGAPPKVAALKQRIGRSGRGEDQTRVMRVYLPLSEPAPDDDILERLYLPLLQTVAATELLLEGWVEPANEAHCDLSTLTQQCISVIAQTGGLQAAELYRQLCDEGAFDQIEPQLFARLLRALGAADVIEQTPTGDLILGLRGERIRQSRDFYAVFLTPEEYSLFHEGRLLGQLPITWAPQPGEHLVFAGRRWLVTSLDESRRQIYVASAVGSKRPNFEGDAGETHDRLREKMREVLLSRQEFPYLDSVGSRLLERARTEAKLANLAERWFLRLAEQRTLLFLWAGDRVQDTIRCLLMAAGANIDGGHGGQGVALFARHGEDELRELVAQALAIPADPRQLAEMLPGKRRRKYDVLLPEVLLEEGLGRDWLDLASARALLARILTAERGLDAFENPARRLEARDLWQLGE